MPQKKAKIRVLRKDGTYEIIEADVPDYKRYEREEKEKWDAKFDAGVEGRHGTNHQTHPPKGKPENPGSQGNGKGKDK